MNDNQKFRLFTIIGTVIGIGVIVFGALLVWMSAHQGISIFEMLGRLSGLCGGSGGGLVNGPCADNWGKVLGVLGIGLGAAWVGLAVVFEAIGDGRKS